MSSHVKPLTREEALLREGPKHLMTCIGIEITIACGAEGGVCAHSLEDATCPECIAIMAETDIVVDRHGGRQCRKCGRVYGKACQFCCEHEHLYIDWDYHRGGIPRCEKCSREFTPDEFDSQFTIVRKSAQTEGSD